MNSILVRAVIRTRMRWRLGLLAHLLLAGCSNTPVSAPVSHPRSPVAHDSRSTTLPDVTAPVPSDHSGAGDAALVVAIERYPSLPAIPGARQTGAEWVRFLVELLGVPRENVTALSADAATRSAIMTAVAQVSPKVRAGGRLWFVFVGHGGGDLVPADGGDAHDAKRRLPVNEVLDVAANSAGQPVVILDTGFDRDVVALLGSHADRSPPRKERTLAEVLARPSANVSRATRRSPIVLEGGTSGLLPAGDRPAFSYFIMGALRGWADENDDGAVTATETIRYVYRALRTLRTGRLGSHPDLYLPVECRALSTLSTLDEKSPNLTTLAPRPLPPIRRAPEDEIRAAVERLHAADAVERGEYAIYEATNGKEGVPIRLRLDIEPGGNEVRVVPVPNAVREAAEARVAYAALLGGPASSEAAWLLLEAARTYFWYGHLDRTRELLGPVVDTRCTVDRAGLDAQGLLLSADNYSGKRKEALDLVALECFFDEKSEREYTRTPFWHDSDPVDRLTRRYLNADSETDPDVSACIWQDVASAYADLLRANPTPVERADSLNGAYAYRRADDPDAAARIYETYLRAQAHPIAGDSERNAEIRHKYTVVACNEFFDVAKDYARLRPAYLTACFDQDWFGCAEGDVADCAGVCPGNPKLCAHWADHAEAGIGVLRDADAARRVKKVLCDAGDDACKRPKRAEIPKPPAKQEFERLLASATGFTRRATDREELAAWGSDDERLARLREALERYRAAENAWRAVLEQRALDPDPARTLLELAQARLSIVALTLSVGAAPSAEEIAAAQRAALDARDATVGERRKLAARLLVGLADRLLEAQEAEFERTHGARGVERRREIGFDRSNSDERRVVVLPMPPAVLDTVRARDDYVASVSSTADLERSRGRYALDAALSYFLFGHLTEARARAEPVLRAECGRTRTGYEAWELLISISNFARDAPAVRQLVKGARCALDPETKLRENAMIEPQRGMKYLDAFRYLDQAARLPEGPERRRILREGAAELAHTRDAAPYRDMAPDAAVAAARGYAELGDYARAIELYRVFFDKYGTEPALAALEKGNAREKPPVKADPQRYADRLALLRDAYAGLELQYFATSDYRNAALTLLEESGQKRLRKDERIEAARRAVKLASMRGAPGMLRALWKLLAELGAPKAEQAQVGSLVSRATAAPEETPE